PGAVPADAPYIIPGFVDLHVHGGGGFDCMRGEADVRGMAKFHARNGTVALCPTTITAPIDEIETALNGISASVGNPTVDEAEVLGAHLEGPFINPGKLGAQPDFAIKPDIHLLQTWLDMCPLKVATLAPEIEGAEQAVRLLTTSRCKVQIGHSLAKYAECVDALEWGVSGFTHLYNAMSGLDHRDSGVVACALAKGDWAEIICDFNHVDKGAIQSAMRAIPHLYAVSDCVEAGGMPDGKYKLGTHEIIKDGLTARLVDGTLAGSVLTLDKSLANFVELETDFHQSVCRHSSFPAKYLNLSDYGDLAVGKLASLLVLNKDLTTTVFMRGKPLEISNT
ncbi:MAG: N-acetylglucosamine-6-phosphate deacetylase, partial [Alphaproteobacteria bacterium]